jgi:hypothetical protein
MARSSSKLASTVGGEAVWAEEERDMKMFSLLDEEGQLNYWEEGLGNSIV